MSRVTHSVPYTRVPVLQPHALDAEAAVAASGVTHIPVVIVCMQIVTVSSRYSVLTVDSRGSLV